MIHRVSRQHGAKPQPHDQRCEQARVDERGDKVRTGLTGQLGAPVRTEKHSPAVVADRIAPSTHSRKLYGMRVSAINVKATDRQTAIDADHARWGSS
jgi:hypothetical protein